MINFNIKKIIAFVAIALICSSCVSVPKEVVDLSKIIGKEIGSLHKTHRNFVELYYKKIEDNVSDFIEDIYTPYIINFVLKGELDSHKKGEESLYGDILKAGQSDKKEYAEKALKTMQEFQEAAYRRIEYKREELLSPIIKQKEKIVNNIDESYEALLHMNTDVTLYLKSIEEVKKSQEKVMSILGIDKQKREEVMDNLVKASKITDDALKKLKEVDIKSSDAKEQIEQFSKQIEDIIKK